MLGEFKAQIWFWNLQLNITKERNCQLLRNNEIEILSVVLLLSFVLVLSIAISFIYNVSCCQSIFTNIINIALSINRNPLWYYLCNF